jgi:serine/threonine protein kinase
LYIAPELFWGKPASIRSDIYALGVVLYQLLVGDFGRLVTIDWAKQIKDPLLREDLEKCFAGDPQDRFPGSVQLAEQLRGMEEKASEFREATSYPKGTRTCCLSPRDWLKSRRRSKSWDLVNALRFVSGSMNLTQRPWLSSGKESDKSEQVKRP